MFLGDPYKRLEKADRTKRARFQARNGRVVIHSSAPKSATHYLKHLLLSCLREEYAECSPTIPYGYGNNFLNPSDFLKKLDPNRHWYIYGHIPPMAHNLKLLRALTENLHFVVTIRPLPDIVVSYADHVAKGNRGPLDWNIPGLVECRRDWADIPDERRYAFIIRYILPWYVRFLASYLLGDMPGRLDLLTFEEVVLTPQETTRRLVRRIEGADIRDVPQDIFSKKVNFNNGQIGRSARLLRPEHFQAIRELLEDGPLHDDPVLAAYLTGGLEQTSFNAAGLTEAKAMPGIAGKRVVPLFPK